MDPDGGVSKQRQRRRNEDEDVALCWLADHEHSDMDNLLLSLSFMSADAFFSLLHHGSYLPTEEERTKQEAAAKVAATTTPPRSPPLTEAVPSPRWQAYQDEGGNVYYYDEVSGQFQWEKPEKNLMTTMER